MTRILPISNVKTHLPSLATTIESRHEQLVVTRHGKPSVVIVSYEDYERLQETLDVLADPAMMRQIHRSLTYFARGGKGRTFESVFGEPLLPLRRRRS